MLKKDITFKDLDGNEVTDTFYFNLTKIELLELDGEAPNGLQARIEELNQLEGEDGVVRGKDLLKVLDLFKTVLRKAYGKRSEDGRRLIKNTQVWEEFESSEAFSALIETFFTDPAAGGQFINAMMPADLLAEAQAEMAKQPGTVTAINANSTPGAIGSPPVAPRGVARQLTQEELIDMDSDDLKSGLATGRYILPGQSGM